MPKPPKVLPPDFNFGDAPKQLPADFNFGQSNQAVPQSVLDNLSRNNSQITDFEKNGGKSGPLFGQPLQENSFLNRYILNPLKGAGNAITQPLTDPQGAVEGAGSGVVSSGFSPGGYPIFGPTGNKQRDLQNFQAQDAARSQLLQSGKEATTQYPGYTTGQILGPVAIGAALKGATGKPSAIPVEDAAANLHKAMVQGGAAGARDLFHETATPAVEPARNAIADLNLKPSDFKGRNAPVNAISVAQRVVDNAEAKLGPIKARVQSIPATEIAASSAKAIQAEVSPMIKQAFPEIASKFDAIAEQVGKARTMGDLMEIRKQLNDMTSKFWEKTTSDQNGVGAGMQAAVDSANIIRRNLYPEISRVTGVDISPLMQEEGAGLQMRTQFQKANPKLQGDISNAEATKFWERVRGSKSTSEIVRNLLDVGPLSKMSPADTFAVNMQRVARGAQPSNFSLVPPRSILEPAQPAGYGPMGPPNPGEGPLMQPGSIRPSPFFSGDVNPGQGPLQPPGSMSPKTSFGLREALKKKR
jgi:hypothetical protein